MASYLIKSGRAELGGKRVFSVVYPQSVAEFSAPVTLPDGTKVNLSGRDLADLSRQWYEAGLDAHLPEQNLRYLKPQATECHTLLPQRPGGNPRSGQQDAASLRQSCTGSFPRLRAFVRPARLLSGKPAPERKVQRPCADEGRSARHTEGSQEERFPRRRFRRAVVWQAQK